MKPEDLAKPNTEHAHQCALMCWCTYQSQWPELVWLFSIPNGGERGVANAARLKAEGVKSGVSDLCLPVPRRGYHGFFIEMKKPGKLSGESANQKKFGAFVTENGYLYACIDNWIDAAKALAWYLGRDDGTY
jgi:hypothetical protein